MLRITFAVAAALAAVTGPAYASPGSGSQSIAAGDRTHAIAARMARGESYDQAARATLPSAEASARAQTIAAQMATGKSHDRAAQAASSADPSGSETLEVVDARWAKHLGAMQAGGAHEAGWAASTR